MEADRAAATRQRPQGWALARPPAGHQRHHLEVPHWRPLAGRALPLRPLDQRCTTGWSAGAVMAPGTGRWPSPRPRATRSGSWCGSSAWTPPSVAPTSTPPGRASGRRRRTTSTEPSAMGPRSWAAALTNRAVAQDAVLVGQRAAAGQQLLGDLAEDHGAVLADQRERAEPDEPIAAAKIQDGVAGRDLGAAQDAVAHGQQDPHGGGLLGLVAAGAVAQQPPRPLVLAHLRSSPRRGVRPCCWMDAMTPLLVTFVLVDRPSSVSHSSANSRPCGYASAAGHAPWRGARSPACPSRPAARTKSPSRGPALGNATGPLSNAGRELAAVPHPGQVTQARSPRLRRPVPPAGDGGAGQLLAQVFDRPWRR